MVIEDELIYIIDDEVGILELLDILLSDLGYEVVCFTNIDDYRQAIKHVLPTIIITDLVLGENCEGGESIALELLEKWPHIPVFIMSGYLDQEKMVTLSQLKSIHIQAKPFDMLDFTKTLEQKVMSFRDNLKS